MRTSDLRLWSMNYKIMNNRLCDISLSL